MNLKLSDREKALIGELVKGKSCKEIAEVLQESVRSVEGVLDRLRKKLDVTSSTGLLGKVFGLEQLWERMKETV